MTATGTLASSDTAAMSSFKVTVDDAEAPTITGQSVDPRVLWPVDHKWQDVMVSYTASDNCAVTSRTLNVTSNEPVDETGDGNTEPDWIVIDDHRVRLRRERAGTGTGRIYTITIKATDAHGNLVVQTVEVLVPHNQR